MKHLNEVFAIQIAAFAIITNHYHIILLIDREQALQWTNEDVMDHWCELFKGELVVDRRHFGELLSVAEEVAAKTVIELWPQRLFDLSWFMIAAAHLCALRHS